MALTESTMLPLQTEAPNFQLIGTDGKTYSLADFAQHELLVVAFICNHCPYVIHIAPALAQMAEEYLAKGVGFVAINSNDTDQYPADSFERMAEEKSARGYAFPYLFDADQSVAQRYGAACTPDIYVFDKNRQLAYRGQFDDTRPNRISSGNYDSSHTPAHGGDLKKVLDNMLSGQAPTANQIPSMGCNIKWKLGNEPEYV